MNNQHNLPCPQGYGIHKHILYYGEASYSYVWESGNPKIAQASQDLKMVSKGSIAIQLSSAAAAIKQP